MIRRSLMTAAAVACAVGCASHARTVESGARVEWLVLAPHPDDELLIAGGVLAMARARGESVAVAIMTNGDFDCIVDGLRRERESVHALSRLGVDEAAVHFLGYPDGSLALLGDAPLASRRIGADGRCAEGATTYGAYGAGHAEVHRARFGVHAEYTREAAVADLMSLLDDLRPVNVAVTHAVDTHPDHSATYALLRTALERMSLSPVIHRSIVHNGDCFPLGAEAHEPCPPVKIAPDVRMPPLTGRLAGYEPRERIALLPRVAAAKVAAIAEYVSQTHGTFASYLFSFARSDEPFFPESFVSSGGTLRRRDAPAFAPAHAERLPAGSPRELEGGLPFRMVFAMNGDAITLRALDDDTGAYVLVVDPARREARLSRSFGSDDADAHLVQAWPLPHDSFAAGRSDPFELRIVPAPGDGDVAEIELWRGGSLVGATVDLHPRRVGVRLAASRSLDVVVSAFPSARRAR